MASSRYLSCPSPRVATSSGERFVMVNLAGGLLFSLAAALPISLFAPSLVGLYTDNACLYPLALDILKYLDICELSRELSNRIAVCAEETMNSLIGLKTQEGESCRHFFDVRMMEIMDDAGSQSRGIQFFLKARGKSFNPVRELSLNPDSMMTGNALSLLLVNKLCDQIDYNYRNGVNCVVMKFFK